MAALLLPVLLAMTGMAIDVGGYASERRSLQNSADAIALAAAQELPSNANAQAKANEYAAAHGVSTSQMTVTVLGGTTAPAVRVVLSKPHNFIFMKIVGLNQQDVGAVAKAGLFSPTAGSGVVPWSVTQGTVDTAMSGDEVVIKYDASSTSYGQGNFAPIRVDGSGSSDYEDAAKYGSDFTICSSGMADCSLGACPGSFPSTCGENSGECDGPECPPKTGNMTGGTRDAVDFRMNNTSSSCDEFDEVFSPLGAAADLHDAIRYAWSQAGTATGGRLAAPAQAQPTNTPTRTPTRTNTPVPTNTHTPLPTNTPAPTNTSGPSATPTTAPSTSTPVPTASSNPEYELNPNCNPWGAGQCTSNTDSNCSRRVFVIPVVNSFGNGSSDPVTIVRFALVFLEGYDSGRCQGNSCEIKARFVRADFTTNFFSDGYDASSSTHFVKLIE